VSDYRYFDLIIQSRFLYSRIVTLLSAYSPVLKSTHHLLHYTPHKIFTGTILLDWVLELFNYFRPTVTGWNHQS